MKDSLKNNVVKITGILAIMSMLAVPAVAFAANNQSPSDSAEVTSVSQEEETGTEADRENETEEDAALASQAKITQDEAVTAARKYAGLDDTTNVTVEGLGSENGVVVYEITYLDTSGKEKDLKVDAVTGEVSEEQEDDNTQHED